MLLTRKRYPARFITQLVLCHPTRVMIYPAHLGTRLELRCNSFCTLAQVVINNHPNFWPFWHSDCFIEKTLVAFDFDKKHKQNIAQITMQYHVSKDFLRLIFAVDQVLSISGYDLENGRMQSKQKYWIKNTAVKILVLMVPFWFLSTDFCLFCWLFPVSIVAASYFNYICCCRWF